MEDFNVTSLKELMPQACNGVYIQDINGKLWKTEDWDCSVNPNAIAVVADEAKFLIALTEPSSTMETSGSHIDPLENYTKAISSAYDAKADYDGAGNTANILQMQPSTNYAAGYCNAFIFPDGKTKGFLPSLGQLKLAYQNKSAVDAALNKCGCAAMGTEYYYCSSTFWGVEDDIRRCWALDWDEGFVSNYCYLSGYDYVRPFANF